MEIKKKCLIIYPFFAYYRKHILDALFRSNFGWEFELVGDPKTSFGIKGIDPNLANITIEKGGYNWTFARNSMPISIMGKRLPVFWQPGAIKRVIKNDYDAVIMMGSIYYVAYLLAIPFLKFSKKPIIFWTHGFLGKDNIFFENLRHLLYKRGDAFLLYGNRAKEIMLKSGKYEEKKLYTIYNSLDYEPLKLVSQNKEAKSKLISSLFSNCELPIVIASGRVTIEKGLSLLLEALRISVEKFQKPFNLLIIGDGPELENLKAYVVDNKLSDFVNFTGAIYGSKVFEYMSISKLSVIPGNVGLSAMHAMASGLPVISHDNFDIQMPEFEAIIEGETGSFYKYNDVYDLVSKIHYWIFNKKLLKESYEKCKNRIYDKYHVRYQIKVIEECLNSLKL